MAGLLAPQEKSSFQQKGPLRYKLQNLDMQVQGLSESNPKSTRNETKWCAKAITHVQDHVTWVQSCKYKQRK